MGLGVRLCCGPVCVGGTLSTLISFSLLPLVEEPGKRGVAVAVTPKPSPQPSPNGRGSQLSSGSSTMSQLIWLCISICINNVPRSS